MANGNAQLPWTNEQWARVQQVVREQAETHRVAAKFLPVHGPLDPDASLVPKEVIWVKFWSGLLGHIRKWFTPLPLTDSKPTVILDSSFQMP